MSWKAHFKYGLAAFGVASTLAANAFAQSPGAEDPRDALGRIKLQGQSIGDFYVLSARRAALLIDRETGQKYSEWAIKPLSANRIDVVWGDPNNWPSPMGKAITVEEWSIKSNCAGGKTFVWLDVYRNDFGNASASNRFEIKTTHADIRIGDGPWIDITEAGC